MIQQEVFTKETIEKEFNEAMKALINIISAFTNEEFNSVPAHGGWTGGQVAEHLHKSMSRLPHVLSSETIVTDRSPFERCYMIRSIFLNFETKLQSPSFILPGEELKSVDFFAGAFQKAGEEIMEVATRKDLTQLVVQFPFPQIGEMTGWEWIYFTAAHCIRHTRQLKNILEQLHKN